MWIEDFANFTRAAAIDGVGNNVFAYTLKSTDSGAMFTALNTGILADSELIGLYKGPMQLIVRSQSIPKAQTQAKAISDLINSNERRRIGLSASYELPSASVKYVYPRHLPVVFPRSDGDFYEASVNFDVCFAALSG